MQLKTDELRDQFAKHEGVEKVGKLYGLNLRKAMPGLDFDKLNARNAETFFAGNNLTAICELIPREIIGQCMREAFVEAMGRYIDKQCNADVDLVEAADLYAARCQYKF